MPEHLIHAQKDLEVAKGKQKAVLIGVRHARKDKQL